MTTMSRCKKKRLSFDDLLPTEGPENFEVIQKQGKLKVARKNQPKKVPVPYRLQYPIFWSLLKQNPAIPDPVEEYIFHPVRKWRIDIAWPDHKLAFEIEGGVFKEEWKQNEWGKWEKKSVGHRSISGFLKDMEKYNALSVCDWRLLRATPDQVKDCSAYDLICEWFNQNVPGFREKSIHRDAF